MSKTGKLQQHKFLLGTDRKEAERRERKLRELWDTFEKSCSEGRPLWSDALLLIAQRVAKGLPDAPIPRGPREMQHQYAARIQRMQARYPVISFVPEDQHAYEIGQAALELFEAIPDKKEAIEIRPLEVDVYEAQLAARKIAVQAGLVLDPALGIAPVTSNTDGSIKPLPGILKPSDPAAALPVGKRKNNSPVNAIKQVAPKLPSPSASLYRAFKSYQVYLEKEYFRHETGHVSLWGQTQIRQIKNLKSHHPDRLLSVLDGDAVGELIGYWRRRPCKIGTKDPMTAKSASNYLGTLMRFLSWLHTSSEFQWEKPFAFSDYDTRIRRLPTDHVRKSIEQVDTFSLDELRLLMRYGQPFERLLLVLSLNCGFGRAEISSLLVGEVQLFQGHSEREQEVLGFVTTDEDSFIKRIRRKSGVYGEHILFPMTVQAIEWALERRMKFPAFGDHARLILTEKGTALDKQTVGSNANQAIPNHFSRLIKRIQEDGNEIRNLSFGKLRKTASDLIKRHSNGEIAGVFDCHGEPVKSDSLSDVYTNRPFGKVFQAIRDVQKFLAPVFKEAGNRPFAPQAQAYTKRSTIERIIELHEKGVFTGQIAAAVGVSGQTVSRHIQQYREARQSQAEAAGT